MNIIKRIKKKLPTVLSKPLKFKLAYAVVRFSDSKKVFSVRQDEEQYGSIARLQLKRILTNKDSQQQIHGWVRIWATMRENFKANPNPEYVDVDFYIDLSEWERELKA